MDKKIPDIMNPEFERLLLESMADGVFTLDDSGKITSWNPAMERISGYSAGEAVGESCTLLNFNRCFRKSCPEGIIECGIYKHERIDGKECFLKHKNGNDVPVIKSARILRDKNASIKGVVETVTDLTELHKARREAEDANRKLGEIHRFDNIIGKSSPMQRVFSTIKAAASSDATILIQGESGSGKELVAGAVHYNSSRVGMPFVTVNSSALSESLLESELFGHVKGAFTGAVRDRTGRFEEAEGGTLFLDEIGELSPFIQVKLLRVLQERELERVGESKKRKIDIRVITATNRDLYGLVQSGHFREDLYYRLKVFPINIPPLRERKKDIPILTSHFIKLQNHKTGKQITGVSQEAMRILLDYNWPGNVRELENAVEHAFVLCEGLHIDIFDLPVEIRRMEYRPHVAKAYEADEKTGPFRKKLTREFLLETLEESNWNKAEVARRVGFSRAAIWKYMTKWNIPMKRP
ncbi:MAG: PAS domain S-box protein [Deltaproteobacteria bacterium]|nr:PAS domain S-box protein [Deltaproteobacteria bacterium]